MGIVQMDKFVSITAEIGVISDDRNSRIKNSEIKKKVDTKIMAVRLWTACLVLADLVCLGISIDEMW
jgi:hypothetical protein